MGRAKEIKQKARKLACEKPDGKRKIEVKTCAFGAKTFADDFILHS